VCRLIWETPKAVPSPPGTTFAALTSPASTAAHTCCHLVSSSLDGTHMTIHLPEKFPSEAGGTGAPWGLNEYAYTHSVECGVTPVGGYFFANETGLLFGWCVNHGCVGWSSTWSEDRVSRSVSGLGCTSTGRGSTGVGVGGIVWTGALGGSLTTPEISRSEVEGVGASPDGVTGGRSGAAAAEGAACAAPDASIASRTRLSMSGMCRFSVGAVEACTRI
jgi:hypothetical protein